MGSGQGHTTDTPRDQQRGSGGGLRDPPRRRCQRTARRAAGSEPTLSAASLLRRSVVGGTLYTPAGRWFAPHVSDPDRPRRPDKHGTAPAVLGALVPRAVLVAVLAHNLHATWLRWGSAVIDSGRELEVARLLAHGGLLYRDARHYYGPVAPYVNGLLFALFGAHTSVLVAAGVASAAAMAELLRALGRRLLPTVAATAVAAAFLYLCAFGDYYFHNIFNWVLPYTYSATYGMLAATASLFLLVRHVADGRARDLHFSVACLVLAALGKIETTLPTVAAHLVFVATERPRLGSYLVGGATALAVFTLFLCTVGTRLVGDYLSFALSPTFRTPILLHSGLGGWREALRLVGRSAGAVALTVLLVWGASAVERRTRLPALGRWATTAGCAVGAALIHARLTIFEQFRALPLVLAVVLGHAALRWRRTGDARRSELPPLLVIVFAIGCLVRMLLSTGAFHYGFYLLPVPLLAYAFLWLRVLPDWLPGRPARLAVWAGAGVLAAVLLTHTRVARELDAKHNTLVQAPRGTLYLLDDLLGYPTGKAEADAVHFLSQYPPTTRILAVPVGAGLAFLAGLESVCGMHSFLPPELDGPFEDRLLACLDAAPPDLVVRVGINIVEFGSRGFGEDYAERSAAWILAHYVPVASFGPGGYVLILGRGTL